MNLKRELKMQGQKDLYKLLLRQMANMGDVYTMTTFGQGHGYASHTMFHPGISDSARDLRLPSAKKNPISLGIELAS